MPPQGNPSRQPRSTNPNAPRVGGRFNSMMKGASRMFDRGVRSGLHGLSGSGYKRPEKTKKSGALKSPYFEDENSYMLGSKVESRIKGMRGAKEDKVLALLRAKSKLYNPKRHDDPHFSWNEGSQTVAEARKFYGDKVAKDVEKELHKAFAGKHTISLRKAQDALRPISSRHGKKIGEGAQLIAGTFDPKFQGGRGAQHFTKEKLESLVQETALSSGPHAARSLKQQFMATEEKNPTASFNERRRPSMWSGLAKRAAGSVLGSRWSPGGNTKSSNATSAKANQNPTPNVSRQATTWNSPGVGNKLSGFSGRYKGNTKTSSETKSTETKSKVNA